MRVWFKDNKLYERIGDRFKVISSRDSRLVYLVPHPAHCSSNETNGYPAMLGKTCTSHGNKSDCKNLIALCGSCNLKPETEEYFEEVKCIDKPDQICLNNYFVTTCTAGGVYDLH